jgi:hypothetical protein
MSVCPAISLVNLSPEKFIGVLGVSRFINSPMIKKTNPNKSNQKTVTSFFLQTLNASSTEK